MPNVETLGVAALAFLDLVSIPARQRPLSDRTTRHLSMSGHEGVDEHSPYTLIVVSMVLPDDPAAVRNLPRKLDAKMPMIAGKRNEP